MTVLDTILAGVREDLAARQEKIGINELRERALATPVPPQPNLRGRDLSVIAEVKRSSPSLGAIAEITDPAELAQAYAAGGASAISVLTEQRQFSGSLADLDAVRAGVDIPILRKDFVVDAYQVYENRLHQASLTLLIVAALDDEELTSLYDLVSELGMTALVEVHTPDEARRAADLGASLVGINNRNLKTLEVDLSMFERLAPMLDDEAVKVAESGVLCGRDAARVRRAGADAVLVGTALVRHGDPTSAVAALIEEAR